MRTSFINLIIIFCIYTLISCSDKNIEYDSTDFYVEISPQDTFYAQNGELNLKIRSEKFKQGKTIMRVIYNDDKNSILTTPGGENIYPGGDFMIDTNFEESQTYTFNSLATGEHKIGFTFFNSANYGRKYQTTITVGGDFKFLTKLQKTVTYTNGGVWLDYEMKYNDSKPQTPYKLKFEIEDQSQDATLSEINKNKWFDINNSEGSLFYVPKTSGIHKVNLTIKNKYGVEKTVSFQIEVGLNNLFTDIL